MSGTGTTGTAGCVTRRSVCTRSCSAGYEAEAVAWRDWLLRAVAGAPDQLQTMYGAAGERRLPELVLDWLPGYEASAPVRIGNAASNQFQLDVYGEVMDCLHQARRAGVVDDDPSAWDLQLALMEFLEGHWRDPDEGIWEVRGPRRDFTHSKVMAWVAADRAVKAVEQFALAGSRRPVAPTAVRHPRRGLPRGLRRRPTNLHPVVRRAPSSTPAC